MIAIQQGYCQQIPGITRYEVIFAEGEPSLNSCYPFVPPGLPTVMSSHQRGFTAWCCWFGRCGNGAVDNFSKIYKEECDDGNTVSGDGCSAECKIEVRPSLSPSASQTPLPTISPNFSPSASHTPLPTSSTTGSPNGFFRP